MSLSLLGVGRVFAISRKGQDLDGNSPGCGFHSALTCQGSPLRLKVFGNPGFVLASGCLRMLAWNLGNFFCT